MKHLFVLIGHPKTVERLIKLGVCLLSDIFHDCFSCSRVIVNSSPDDADSTIVDSPDSVNAAEMKQETDESGDEALLNAASIMDIIPVEQQDELLKDEYSTLPFLGCVVVHLRFV